MRLSPGDPAPKFEARDISGQLHRLEDYQGGRLLLSFHRYAACPMCNLHIHELSTAWQQLHADGLRMLAVFISGAKRVQAQYGSRDVPFPLIADEARQLYVDYGIEYSVSGMLVSFVHPRAMKAFFSGFMPGRIDGPTTTLPADFLIGPDLRIADVWYSSNITQHMSLERIRAFAATGR